MIEMFLVLFLVVVGILAWLADEFFFGGIAIAGAVMVALWALVFSERLEPARMEYKAKNAAQAAADLQPRVIREADGCKVYAFKSSAEGRWHYFTRCPDSRVTTDTTQIVRQGKSTREETTQIVTEAGK